MSATTITVAVVNVVGPIGAGKTTMMARALSAPREFVRCLAQMSEFSFLRDWPSSAKVVVAPEEPSNWVNDKNQSLLDLVYNPTTRKQYSFELQKTILLERLRSIHNQVFSLVLAAESHILLITDGSIHTDHDVFARASYEAGNMTEEQWKKYDVVYGSLVDNWKLDLAKIVERNNGLRVNLFEAGTLYLQTPLDETQDRIEVRGRPCEKDIPVEYLQNIWDRHDYVLQSAAYPVQPVVAIESTPLEYATPFVLINKM